MLNWEKFPWTCHWPKLLVPSTTYFPTLTTFNFFNIYINKYVYQYIYIHYIFIYVHIFWPEWISNPRPRAHRAHTPPTELSGRQWGVYFTVMLFRKPTIHRKVDRSWRVRITLAANFLHFLFFQPRSELISDYCLHQSPHWVFENILINVNHIDIFIDTDI